MDYRKYEENPELCFDTYLQEHFNERELISPDWSWAETAYHYNLIENGIIDLLLEHMLNGNPDAFEDLRDCSVLDVGSGTGHWIKFYRDIIQVKTIVSIDFSETVVKKLQSHYGGSERVHVKKRDIGANGSRLGEFEIINAIGVLFHIVDDYSWSRALDNLISHLSNKGVAIIGGEFFDRTERISTWRRVRSKNTWEKELLKRDCQILDIHYFDWFRGASEGGITDNLLCFKKIS